MSIELFFGLELLFTSRKSACMRSLVGVDATMCYEIRAATKFLTTPRMRTRIRFLTGVNLQCMHMSGKIGFHFEFVVTVWMKTEMRSCIGMPALMAAEFSLGTKFFSTIRMTAHMSPFVIGFMLDKFIFRREYFTSSETSASD